MRIPILPIIAVGSLAWAVSSVVSSQPKREVTEPPVMPPRTSFERTIAAIGLVEPSSEAIAMGSHRHGVVEKVLVKLGEEVKAGQALIKLDTRDLEAELEVGRAMVVEAEAKLAVAKAEETQARRNWEFAEKLKDSRAISEEERTQRETGLAMVKAQVGSAEAACLSAKARLRMTDTEIERSVVKAPIDGTVLQVKVRAGEFVSAAAAGSAPWMTLGETKELHVRADVDEHEAWRVNAGAKARAHVRGNPELKVELEFVRFEPLVVPKKSLTGDATERVDTRVLQVIYRVVGAMPERLFIGQQMDVFVEAIESQVAGRP
jgi:RND family efflux transporter MFP subunit